MKNDSTRSGLLFGVVLLLTVAIACSPSKDERAVAELGIEANAYDLSNLDHLLFLYKYASGDDRQRAALMTKTAHDERLMDPASFPMVAYFESLLAYPNSFTLLGIANGYLRIANRLKNLAEPAQQRQAEEYYRNAEKFFNLTLAFSGATGQHLHDKQHADIVDSLRSALNCIQHTVTGPTKANCVEVLDI